MIDILPSLGLQDDECQYVIDDLLEERKEMGLPPAKDFEVYIGLNTYPAPAAVDRSYNKQTVMFNVLPAAKGLLNLEKQISLAPLSSYLKIVQEFSALEKKKTEVLAIKSIYNPVKGLAELAEAHGDWEKHCSLMEQKGISLENLMRFITQYGEQMKESLENDLPEATIAALGHIRKSLRHEMDHVAFGTNNLFQYFLKIEKDFFETSLINPDLLDSSHTETCDEFLKCLAEALPATEASAFLLERVIKGDVFQQSPLVNVNICLEYINKLYVPGVIDALCLQALCHGEDVNNDTRDFLLLSAPVPEEIRILSKNRCNIDNVNFSFADTVMYQRLPAWQFQASRNTRDVVDAITHAHLLDTKLLNEAQGAKSFKDYVRICCGD